MSAGRLLSPREAVVPDFGALVEPESGDDQVIEHRLSMREYAELVPEPAIGPLRFEDFPFQEAWYSEEVANAAEVVFAKSAQVGASAYALRWALRQADVFADTGLYVMPNDANVHTFGDERIEPAIEASEYLRSRILGKYVRSKGLKRVGMGWLHLRGSNSKAGAQSVAAQFLALDELDLLDQSNLAQIERRISGAAQIGKRPKVRRLGYPYLPAAGIDRAWSSSDQRVWHITCRRCGEEQPVSWEDNFRWTMPDRADVMRPGQDVFEDPRVVGHVWRQCRVCEATLEDSSPGARDGSLRTGRWIAQRPGAPVIGFHAWRGMVPVTDLAALVVASRATSEAGREAFEVLDLGRPYTPAASGLTLGQLLAACQLGGQSVEMYAGPNVVTMGVDVAGERDLNVRVSEQLPPESPGVPNPRRALWIGRVESFEALGDLIERFRPRVVAIDANPERRSAKALRARYPGRVVLVQYTVLPDAPPMKLATDEAGVPLMATVQRTDAIDAMFDSIRQLRNRPLKDPPPGWMEQMQALRRRTRTDAKGRPVRVYDTTGTAGDDYAHADVYDLVATELWRTLSSTEAQLAAAAGRHVDDAELGFSRVRLADYSA